ncbi:MAG: type II toxin-antitoxin system VapC family toxin [Thermoanaerobaculia bacterium]
MMRIFIDTDVILDLLLAREPFFPSATELFLRVQAGEIEGFVSPLIFSNLFYILRKELSAPLAISALRKLKLLVRVLPVDERTIELALASSFVDFEDAIQYYTALEHGLDGIVTRNKQDYRSAKLPVFTAGECLELYGSQRQ